MSTTIEPLLSREQIERAAFNKPAEEFTLGDRTFLIQDLPYDDYTEFVSHLAPVVEQLFSKLVMSRVGVELPNGINIEPSSITAFDMIKVCSGSLPEMAHIICRQTDPTITVEEVKRLAKTPIAIAEVVIRQIVLNGMIKDLLSFFGQMISMLKALR